MDRPSSVVKELVENSLDAGATEITVIVKDGGKSLIQVVDNGQGMTENDAILSFERHSTSKISTVEDLHRIQTLGFRGEALASIASVSMVEMKTRVPEEPEGTLLKLEGGLVKTLEKTAWQQGTSIAVKNLFFNTPARRKFMKTDNAEYRHILTVLNRFLLSYPEVSFTLYRNTQQVFHYPKQSLEDRIAAVLGETYRENSIPVDFEFAGIHVSGYVGNMDLFRASRGYQYLFLNRRYIVNKSLNYAVSLAYGSMLPQGNYPFYRLNLHLNPDEVDVNVHPSKIEVRFEDERLVFRSILNGVKEALNSAQAVPVLRSPEDVPEFFEPIRKPSFQGTVPGSSDSKNLHFPFEFRQSQRKPHPIGLPSEQDEGVSSEERSVSAEEQPPGTGRPQIKQQLYKASQGERVSVWQLHKKYIFSQIKSGLIIIDQHLAHERILFEQAMEHFNKRPPSSQQLLFPRTVELNAEDFEVLREIQYYLSKLGFIVKDFGGRTVVIEAVPTDIRGDEETILRQMIDDYKNLEERDIREKVAASFACKSAIKAGDPLSQEEMISLIDGLFATKNPYFCPHGRPVIITMPLEELDKRFLRL
ncbi:MAG: DNA mismatch repair endonuclease MutL [Calditrichaeota bacterium]|nr:DNA mismatch repair endonuclease MutL [Calditrichota bacterium]